MTTLHYLNVGAGDCTIIQHFSGRVTMVDICGGNLPRAADRPRLGDLFAGSLGGAFGSSQSLGALAAVAAASRPPLGGGLLSDLWGAFGGYSQPHSAVAAATAQRQPAGNFGMGEEPKNPLDYLQRLNASEVHRFISTHPEMDHMDGLDALFRSVSVVNFWHTGVRRDPPDFRGQSRYDPNDWARYQALRANRVGGTIVLQKRCPNQFPFANRNEDGTAGGDSLFILAPSDALVQRAEELDDINESSYVLALSTPAGWVVIPGDAHDESWAHVLATEGGGLANCALLLAPHHGRDSERDYAFLDVLRPQLTLMGCAPAKDMGYASWRNRSLPFITNNQAGDICVDLSDPIGPLVWVENESFAQALGYRDGVRNAQGQSFVGIYQRLR